MNYWNPTPHEITKNRIIPTPQSIEIKDGNGLFLSRTSKFTLTAPTADFGPVMTAVERTKKLFTSHCGENCFSDSEEAIKIVLSVSEDIKIPSECNNRKEGYSLKISEKEIEITGFGGPGLLYGVITLEQLNVWDIFGCKIPAMDVIDWPDNPTRGFKQECRWGSDKMDLEEWMLMLEDMVSKKMNALGIAFYGCWGVEYDGRVSEYLFMPVKNHPELRTPKMVKYWSPEENRWIEYEKLPPIFEENFLDAIFRRARDLGIQIIPGWNSYGHNTLLPAMIPEVSSKDEEGNPSLVGFCTSNPATYDLLFSIYDQLIDDYMLPYGMTAINLCLDEVHAGIGKNANDIYKLRDPWCSCPNCRGKDHGDIYLDHVVKIAEHIQKKGMETIIVACDMLDPKRKRGLGQEDLPQRLMEKLKKLGIDRNLMLGWWSYHDDPKRYGIKSMLPELGLRGYVAPWNGYHHWCVALQPLANVKLAAEVNRRDGGEGMMAYSLWDRCADRTHSAIAEYTWNFESTGEPNDLTLRYAIRHFKDKAKDAYRAFRLMDWCTEERFTSKWTIPDPDYVSHWDLLSYRLVPYQFRGVKKDAPYPRAFLDEALNVLLPMRNDIERSLYSISTMAREAKEIFLRLSMDGNMNYDLCMRQAYECMNYEVLAEDWLAIFEIYSLTQSKDHLGIATIARARQKARLDLIALCERAKERCVMESMAMRQHAIFMQIFADIADYAEKTETPVLDLMNVRDILSPTSFWLR